jgi:hypothetical protein
MPPLDGPDGSAPRTARARPPWNPYPH